MLPSNPLHHLLMAAPGSEDETIDRVRKLLIAFVRQGVQNKSFSLTRPETAVDFILHGLHGLLVSYIHEGKSATRFSSDALAVIGPILGLKES